MTAEDIKVIIELELKADLDVFKDYSPDFNTTILFPVKQKYKRSNDATEAYVRWTVFEERKDKQGYKIYFDENSKQFGLALNSDSVELIDIGLYGSFLKTLYSI